MNWALFDEINKFTPKKVPRKNRSSDPKGLRTDSTAWVAYLYLGVVIIIMFAFVGRLVKVQITQQDKYLNLANSNRIREISILSERGLIFDRNDKLLVRNKPRFALELNTLVCNLGRVNDICPKTLEKVQEFVELDMPRIQDALNARKTNILLAIDLTQKEILVLEAHISELPGVSVVVFPSRDYLFDKEFAHVIGYVGLGENTIVGKAGLERFYNEYVAGMPGVKVVQINSTETAEDVITVKDSLPGKNIFTYLDHGLQKKAFELLRDSVNEGDAIGGAIVIQDPTNGGVMALVSYPAFSSTEISGGISQADLENLINDLTLPFFNRAIGAVYPPGSVFKMVTASAGLMEGVVSRYTSIFDPGYIQVGGSTFRNWKLDGHGDVNMRRALQVSNDTYFYLVGGQLGIEKLHEWATKLGFGKTTDIDLGGEVGGFMPNGTHREWYLGDDYISAIGQGDILVTPLQINNMVTYFANGGYLYKPQIVKSIDGVGEFEPIVIGRHLVGEGHYDLIREGMSASVKPGGTGYPLFNFPISVAGKTGTAEYVMADGEIGTHAWFTVFAPYYEEVNDQANISPSEKPIVLTVLLEGGGSGSDDAAPIARELLDFWFEE
ncbi:penicillin-binding protein 2 [Patescibacteria group bacterium]